MCLSNSELDQHIISRDLIEISRSDLGSNKLQAFPLVYSPKLLLFRYVYDFHLEGLMLVRREDITDSFCNKTNKFQRKLLEVENKLKRNLFRSHHSVDSFSSFLRGLDPKQIVVIENESPKSPQFYIGRVISTDKKSIKLLEFTGAGNWERNLTEVPTAEITCCQIESNYINFYSRHFERTSQ